jgi:hypothetical protein
MKLKYNLKNSAKKFCGKSMFSSKPTVLLGDLMLLGITKTIFPSV